MCFIAPEVFAVLWRAERGILHLPFRGVLDLRRTRARSAFRRAGHFFRSVVPWTREVTFSVPWLCLFPRVEDFLRSVIFSFPAHFPQTG